MNRFQLEDFLMKNKDQDEIREAIESDEHITDFIRNIYGGDTESELTKVKTEVVDMVANPETHMEIYKPVITRPIMSKFEYVGAITSLALYLRGLKSIAKYIEIVDCNSLINPSELAFHLLDQGKMNILIIRNRNEKVSFSELHINQLWREEIIEYFKNKNASMENEFYKVLSSE